MTRDESRSSVARYGRCGPWLAVLAIAGLTACGDGNGGDKPASQVAAKVNKEELSVHQLNLLLLQQRGVKPDQADAVSRQLLEQLIDQELAIQKAGELKLDRDPGVLQRVDAARRDIVARAYTEKVGSGATQPTAAEISAYFASNPALFGQRRVYNFREFAIEAAPGQIDGLRKKLEGAQSIDEFTDYLKANGLRFGSRQLSRAAEQIPLKSLARYASLKDGQATFTVTPSGAEVLYLVSSRSLPVSEAQASPAIGQFLLNERKRKLIDEDMRSLRAAAKIEYVGSFAQSAASAAEMRAAEAASAAVVEPESVAMPAPALPSASGLDASSIAGGMGLKKGGTAQATAEPPASAALDAKSIESGMGLKR